MNRETILLCTGLLPLKVAEMLADALGTEVHMDGEVPIVRRPVSGEWHDRANVGGEVYENYQRDETAEPGEQGIYDFGYDILYKVSVIGNVPGDFYAFQAEEARRIFTEITEQLPFPAVHAQEGGLILSAWNPELGLTDFPPHTGAGPEHRDLWEPYAHPAARR
ncbi:MAG: hypothetical protein ACRDT6_04920 [Micromonosporaceae bacterium]